MLKLNKNRFTKKDFSQYKKFVTKKQHQLIQEAAKTLLNRRILHLNSTPKGGGVAEMLKSLIPLAQSMGVDASWYSFQAPVRFFSITKRIHNGLQGANVKINDRDFNYYLEINRKLANKLSHLNFDLAIIHDPQPLAVIKYLHKSPIVARIHLDLSTPNKDLLSKFAPLLTKYDRIVFSLDEFIPVMIPREKTTIIEPAIDPLIRKNIAFSKSKQEDIMKTVGVDPKKPIITQVSRFDPWKDPLGVIEAYFIAKEKIRDLQLVFVGLHLEKDSPDARQTYKKALEIAQGDQDIHLFFHENQFGIKNDDLVNAFQSGSNIIIQKSKREGFGLTVTEAMYKEKIVIGGDAAGIKKQIKNGYTGYIVKNSKQAANLITKILENPKKYQKIGIRAHASVNQRYLITRLLLDHLTLYKKTLNI